MGLFDTLLGRTKPVPANLDALFALPSANLTLESAAGMTASGRAGVCYKPPTGQSFADMQAEVDKLLAMDGGGTLHNEQDNYGYHWVVVENPDLEALVSQIHLVNSSLADAGWGSQLLCSVFGLAPMAGGSAGGDAGALNAGADADADAGADAGSGAEGESGAQGESTTTSGGASGGGATGGSTPAAGIVASTAYLVYLFKRGSFYPFVPDGHERRDTTEELKLKSLVAGDLKVEEELDRWFPLWDLPVG